MSKRNRQQIPLAWYSVGPWSLLIVWGGAFAPWIWKSLEAIAPVLCLCLVVGVAWPVWRSVRREGLTEPEPTGPDHEPPNVVSQVLNLEFALDEKTRFPCIRLPDRPWMQLLPVTKLQVEQWVAEGGHRVRDARQVMAMIQRMEHPASGDLYPPTVTAVRRRPIRNLGPQDVLSVIATNLGLWSDPQELEGHPSFPTPTSEWGGFLSWLDADVPSEGQATALRGELAALPTRDLLREVVKRLPPTCPTAVQQLLKSLAEGIDPDRRGLPFADSGIWEVVDKQDQHGRLIQGGAAAMVSHPVAIGRTSLWPYLEVGGRHVLLFRELPMVGLRLIPRRVTDCSTVELTFMVTPDSGSIVIEPAPIRCPHVDKSETTMAERCPLCYQPVDRAMWKSLGNIWCAVVRIQEGEGTRTKRVHTTDRPRDMKWEKWAVVSEEMISSDYRGVAENSPGLVRPVCVSGYSQEGKTCFLLSLTGSLFYPDGNDVFSRVFPARLGFRRTLGALAPLNVTGRLNLFRSLEEMWIDGILPLPNPIERALSSPIIFSTNGRRFPRKRNRRLAVIINDVAGEAMGPELALNPTFAHVPCCRDVIYILRASELNASYLRFQQFAAGLKQGLFEGKRIELKKLNLILCISQLDRPGADPDVRKICTQPPCLLPAERRETEFRMYLDGMVRVHEAIRSHLLRRVPNLVTDSEETFSSVRYCGFSAFGNHPLPQTLAPRPDCNGCLVAAPQPVRVMDPLLWILWDNRLFDR